jgi:hypothetical protein
MKERERTLEISKISTTIENKMHALVIDMENIYEKCHSSKKNKLWTMILDVYTLIDTLEKNDNKLTKIEMFFKLGDIDDAFKMNNWKIAY